MARFAQYVVYLGGGYQIQSEPREAVVCLCGRPISTAKLNPRNEEDRSFLDSMKLAEEYWEQAGQAQLMEQLRRDFITRAEFLEMSDHLSALETILLQLRKDDPKDDKKTPG
jgi:hypothetical protein